jgi:hypothetical protein
MFSKECCFTGIRVLLFSSCIPQLFLFHKILGPNPACLSSLSDCWNAETSSTVLNACSLSCLREINTPTLKHIVALLRRFCLQTPNQLQQRENRMILRAFSEWENEAVWEIQKLYIGNGTNCRGKP